MENLCFKTADILLPKEHPEKFAVIACDQFTSEPEYWEKAKEFTNGSYTALDLILPEIYLKDDNSEYISKIHKNMKEYLKKGIFREIKDTFIFTNRVQSDGVLRQGLIGKIDLKEYSYKGEKAKIRSTEKTVVERIPPRAEIRKGAPVELPHIMLLFDDKEDMLMKYLSGRQEEFEELYNFDLFSGAGSIKGYKTDGTANSKVQEILNKSEKENDGLIFCVGDGNHSLAAAKSIYQDSGRESDRYALVEIVNIHSPAINFEPIYRVCFGVDPTKTIEKFKQYAKDGEYEHRFLCVYSSGRQEISIRSDYRLPVAALQDFLDNAMPDTKTDYIHGIDSTEKIAVSSADTVGFIFDGMKKTELFEAVIKNGSLPRKTFSMGHALDKRFYLEARRL